MQLKHTRGWKTRLVFWNVLPLSAELCIPLQSIPAAHPGSVCGSGDNKGLCGQAEGRRQSVIGSLNSLAHSSGMPHVLAKTSFCFIQNSCKCAHSQQTTKHTHSLPLAVLPFLPAAFYLSHSHTHTHTLTHIAPLYLVTTTEKVISTTILSVRPCSVKELMRQSLWTYNSSQMQTLGCQLNSFSNAICGMRAPSVWFGLRESEPAVAYELRCVIQLLLLQL